MANTLTGPTQKWHHASGHRAKHSWNYLLLMTRHTTPRGFDAILTIRPCNDLLSLKNTIWNAYA